MKTIQCSQLILICVTLAFAPSLVPAAGTISTTAATKETADLQWNEIKDYTYEQRHNYFSGLNKILEFIDAGISDLNSKRRTASSKSDNVDSDLALKELLTARNYLKSLSRDATKVTVEEWDQMKEKISLAWTETENAYDKARLSTPK